MSYDQWKTRSPDDEWLSDDDTPPQRAPVMRDDIIVSHVYPPIPTRDCDWVAYHDNDVELPWTYGWGATRDEALADLMRLDQERAEADGDGHDLG